MALAVTSLGFMQFDRGINRVPGNVLSSPAHHSSLNCSVYPASCSETAAYRTYYREWHVGPLATANAWTAVGAFNVIVDAAEAAYLLAEVPTWDAVASASDADVCGHCVLGLALAFAMRAFCGLMLCCMGAWIRARAGDAMPSIVRNVWYVQVWTTTLGGLAWLGAAASIQSNLLASFCVHFAHVRYVVGLVFSIIPGMIALPLTLREGSDAGTCVLAGTEGDASVFLELPLVVAWAGTLCGTLVVCICCAKACSSDCSACAAVDRGCLRLHTRCYRACVE